jgi:hypothetical protein
MTEAAVSFAGNLTDDGDGEPAELEHFRDYAWFRTDIVRVHRFLPWG